MTDDRPRAELRVELALNYRRPDHGPALAELAEVLAQLGTDAIRPAFTLDVGDGVHRQAPTITRVELAGDLPAAREAEAGDLFAPVAAIVADLREEARELAKAEREAQRAAGIGRPSSPVTAAGARTLADWIERRHGERDAAIEAEVRYATGEEASS